MTHPKMDPTGTKNYSNVLAFFSIWSVLGFAGLALGKCSKHTLPNGGAYLVGGFNTPEKYWSKLKSSPNRGENKKNCETTT